MADKNPFGSLGLNQMGSERQYMTSLISPEQKRLIKQGILGSAFKAVGAEDFFNKAFGVKPPEQSENINNYQFTKDFTPGTNIQMSGTDVGINPKKPTGLGFAPGSYSPATTTESQPATSVDDENNSAWGHTQTSEFKPRDTSLDQLPQQYALGPVMPPTSGYPQIPQSGGLSKILTSFLG